MSLQPLFQAPLAVQVHAFAALAAFFLGLIQLIGVKGTVRHQTLGYAWAFLMLVVAVTSFWIQDIRKGAYSPIHLLSILTLVMLPLGIFYARGHNIRGHRITMMSLFLGALVIAGLFTLLPGRIMARVVFGG